MSSKKRVLGGGLSHCCLARLAAARDARATTHLRVSRREAAWPHHAQPAGPKPNLRALGGGGRSVRAVRIGEAGKLSSALPIIHIQPFYNALRAAP